MGFDINAKIGADSAAFRREMKRSEDVAKQSAEKMKSTFESAFSTAAAGPGGLFGKILAPLGLAGVAEFASQMAEKVQEKFREIRIGTAQTGLDSDTLQRVQNVLAATGAPAETIAHAFERIAEAMTKIREGGADSEKTMRAMSVLGVTLGTIRSQDVPGAFFQMMNSMKGMEHSAENMAAGKEIFGRQFMHLMPAAAMGFEGPVATSGNLNPADLRELQQQREGNAVAEARKKSFMTRAGMMGNAILGGLTGILFDPFRHVETHEEYMARFERENGPQAEQARAAREAKADADMAEFNRDAARRKSEEETRRNAPLRAEVERAQQAAEMAGMTPAQRRAYLQRALTAQQFEEAEGEGGDEAAGLRQHLKTLGLRRELASLGLQGRDLPMQIDSLARIGGFAQGAGREEMNYYERIARATENTARNTAQQVMDGTFP